MLRPANSGVVLFIKGILSTLCPFVFDTANASSNIYARGRGLTITGVTQRLEMCLLARNMVRPRPRA